MTCPGHGEGTFPQANGVLWPTCSGAGRRSADDADYRILARHAPDLTEQSVHDVS